MNLKGFAIGTFMDIEGAFNHTSSEVIRIAMIRQGVPIAILDWTCHMLGNRNITITKGNNTLRGIVESGCQQGRVLSPLLWSLVVDELLHLLTDQGCHPIGYADDILVIVRGMHLDALMGVMQQTLKVVDTWRQTTELSVNLGKTDLVIFTRRYKWSITRTLELKGQRLEISKCAKYLGVILDNKLTWEDHFENKCNKFIKTLWLCRRVIGTNWGLKADTLLWIFTAILRSRLIYASIVWWSRVNQKTAMAKLERLRGLILRGITGASKSSPTTALGALMGLEPLHLTIKAEAGKAAWRIGENSSTVISKKLRTTANIAKRPIKKMVRDRTSPRYLFDKKYKGSLSTLEDWKLGQVLLFIYCLALI